MSDEQIEIVNNFFLLKNNCIEVNSIKATMKSFPQPDGAVYRFAIAIEKIGDKRIIAPGDDYSQEDYRVQSACANVHTPEVIAAYKAAQEAAQLPA
jgi:hypothetical protein